MDQVTVPVGATPPSGPETVAVKINEEPSAVVGALVVITTEGVTFETTIPYGELGPAFK
jgi:hypothetical protein